MTFRSSPTVADYEGVPEAAREVLVDRTSGAVTGYVPCGRRVDLHFYHATTGIEFGTLPANQGYHLSNDLYEVAGLYVDEIYPEGECKMGDGPRGLPSFEWTPSGARHRDVDILRAAEMHCNIVPQNVSVTAKIRRKADGTVTDVHIPLGKTKPGCSYVFGFERVFNN